MRRPARETFWGRVDKSGDCWLWTGARKNGYGLITENYKQVGAHRISYEMTHGSIPKGMVIDHMCRVRNCVRPEHLQAVTHAQNCENLGGANSDNRSTGLRNVSIHAGRYRVTVKTKHIGYYDTIEEAETAAIKARNEMFTNNLIDRGFSAADPLSLDTIMRRPFQALTVQELDALDAADDNKEVAQ